MARVERIWLKRAHRGPMDEVPMARLVEGKGLEDSVGRSRRRQVTLLEVERWQDALDIIGAAADPKGRRANILLSGMRLERTRGRILAIGETRLAIGGETTPCERMDELVPGLQNAMAPAWRGGAFAQVLRGGIIRAGDEPRWEDPAESA